MNVMRITAKGFGFNGCDSTNPDRCACATWAPEECPLCEQEIIDGQDIIVVTREMWPYLPEDSEDQEWEHYLWHVSCDIGSLAAAEVVEHNHEGGEQK